VTYHRNNLLLDLLGERNQLHENRKVKLRIVRHGSRGVYSGGAPAYGGQEHRNADSLLCARHYGGDWSLDRSKEGIR
jgi:hypothetical protein